MIFSRKEKIMKKKLTGNRKKEKWEREMNKW